MSDLIASVRQFAELIGPNSYLQAAIIAAAFILLGKIADLVISGIVGRIAKRSDNEFDDGLIEVVHRPVFLTFVLLGLGVATRHIDLPETPTEITVNLIKTIAIFVWYGALGRLSSLIVVALRKSSTSSLVQSGMLSLTHNVIKVVLVAMAGRMVYARKIDKQYAWIRGASPAFLEMLPEFPG